MIKRWQVVSLVFFVVQCVLSFLLEAADAGRRRKRRSGGRSITQPTVKPGFWIVVKYVGGLAFGIPICIFIYRVVTDPMTPHLLRELWYRVQEAALVSVGGPEEKARVRNARAARRREFMRARRQSVEYEYGYDDDDPNAMFRRGGVRLS